MQTRLLRFIIRESSQIGEARRGAAVLAAEAGFSEVDASRVALIITELGTNLVKHTADQGGELLVQALPGPAGASLIQIWSLDQGPGITDLPHFMRDGSSTTGTLGEGMGALRRASDCFDIYSPSGKGTAIYCEVRRPGAVPVPRFSFGGLSVPYPGETECGDAWAAIQGSSALTLLAADGLGHGPLAGEASAEAVRTFKAHHEDPLERLFEHLHQSMRKTRGGAVSVARVSLEGDRVTFSGIGNVNGLVVSPESSSHAVSMNGIVGSDIRKVKVFTYPFTARSVLILHSDGLTTKTSLGNHPGLVTRSAPLIAAVLYRDYSRGRDDSTAVVLKGSDWNLP